MKIEPIGFSRGTATIDEQGTSAIDAANMAPATPATEPHVATRPLASS